MGKVVKGFKEVEHCVSKYGIEFYSGEVLFPIAIEKTEDTTYLHRNLQYCYTSLLILVPRVKA